MAYTFCLLSVDPNEIREFINSITNGHQTQSASVNNTIRLWFKDCGPLSANVDNSPVILIDMPIKIKSFLWRTSAITVPQRDIKINFPKYNIIVETIRKRLKGMPRVWEIKNTGRHEYYLQGSIRNVYPQVVAFPSGLRHLEIGYHFVAPMDNESVINKVEKSLRLIGLDDA